MKKILTALCALAIAAMPAFAQNFKELEKKAKSGDAAAMVELGNCFFNGTEGAAKDAKKAKDWYEKAAKAGNLDAYEGLVACYSSWDGIEKNPKKAFEWVYKGVQAGSPAMKLRLGQAYENGDGVPKNLNAAADEYIAAAYGGIAEALVPAVRTGYDAGRFRDLLYLGGQLSNAKELGDEATAMGDEAVAIALYHAYAPEAIGKLLDNTPNTLNVAETKMAYDIMAKNPVDGTALAAALQNAPDDAHSNFLRGVTEVIRGNWDHAASYFATSASQGDPESYVLLKGLADTDAFNTARKMSLITDDPILVYTANTILDSDILKGKTVSAPYNRPNAPIVTLHDWILKSKSITPSALFKEWRGLEEFVLDPEFARQLKPLAADGYAPARRMVEQARYDFDRMQYRLGKYDVDPLEVVKLKNYTSHWFSLNDIGRDAIDAANNYNSTTDEVKKNEYLLKYNIAVAVIYNGMDESVSKLTWVYTLFNDDIKAQYFNYIATERSDLILEWVKTDASLNEVMTIAPGLTVPDLLENAGRAATGDTRTAIENYLRTQYGRSL